MEHTRGVPWDNYFTPAYYRKQIPVWESYAPGLFSDTGLDWLMLMRVLGLALAAGTMAGLLLTSVLRRR
jgi:hypothetical protein